MEIKDLKFPSKGNLDIFVLLMPDELLQWLVGFSSLLTEAGDRTFTLPSGSEIKKILVHRDMQRVKEGKMKLEEVREKFGMDGWLLERTYKQREKEIKAEKNDWNHWGRKWRVARAIEMTKKFSPTKWSELLKGS